MKQLVKSLARAFGYEIRRNDSLGLNAFDDMRRLVSSPRCIVFDVGANIGQTVQRFRKYLPNAVIHSFEPGEDTFRSLTTNSQGLSDVHIVNSGLGAHRETKTFVENELSVMSSFFEPGEDAWGSIRRRSALELDTVDDYCDRNGIEHIDVLKSDTQGFDLEVLRGARKMLGDKKVDLVYLEVTFCNMYQAAPRFDEVCAFLADNKMTIVSFYDMHYRNNRLAWTDALFISTSCLSRIENIRGRSMD